MHSSFRVRQQFSFATMAAKTDLNTYKFNHSMYVFVVLAYRVSNSLANGGINRIRVKDPKESGKSAFRIVSIIHITSRRRVAR